MASHSTSPQVSSIPAKGLSRRKLRPGLRVSEQKVDGKNSYVIKIQETNSYFRFGALEYEMLRLCDGAHTPKELVQAITARHPEIAINETQVIDFLDTVEPSMWERSSREQNVALLERMREQRRSRIDHSSILNIRFRPWNPDKPLTALEPYFRWVFTHAFVDAMHPTLTLPIVRGWMASCDGLATSLDGIMRAELLHIMGIAPW